MPQDEVPAALDWPGAGYVDWIAMPVFFGLGGDVNAEDTMFPKTKLGVALKNMEMLQRPVCLFAAAQASEAQASAWTEAFQSISLAPYSSVRALIILEMNPALRGGGPGKSYRIRNDAAYRIGRELANPYFIGGD